VSSHRQVRPSMTPETDEEVIRPIKPLDTGVYEAHGCVERKLLFSRQPLLNSLGYFHVISIALSYIALGLDRFQPHFFPESVYRGQL
jgi:hypothetical protein